MVMRVDPGDVVIVEAGDMVPADAATVWRSQRAFPARDTARTAAGPAGRGQARRRRLDRRLRGSRASRSPSPTRFAPKTITTMNSPGKTIAHGAVKA